MQPWVSDCCRKISVLSVFLCLFSRALPALVFHGHFNLFVIESYCNYGKNSRVQDVAKAGCATVHSHLKGMSDDQ